MPTNTEGAAGQTAAATYASMKVPELKDLLSQRGLPTSGKKTDLVERLIQADASMSEKDPVTEASLLSSAPLLDGEEAHAGSELELDSSYSGKEGSYLDNLSADTGSSSALNMDGTSAGPKTSFDLPLETGAADKRTSPSSAIDTVKITQSMTEEERRALRKAKFGTKTDEEKKLDRARRFGLSVPELEEEKKRLRAERFKSVPAPGKTSRIENLPVDKLEEERRRKRAERFGIVSEEDKKRKRAERFGVTSEEDKLARRLQRFSNPTSGNASPAPPVKVTSA